MAVLLLGCRQNVSPHTNFISPITPHPACSRSQTSGPSLWHIILLCFGVCVAHMMEEASIWPRED
jgi:hypothetical protein